VHSEFFMAVPRVKVYFFLFNNFMYLQSSVSSMYVFATIEQTNEKCELHSTRKFFRAASRNASKLIQAPVDSIYRGAIDKKSHNSSKTIFRLQAFPTVAASAS
jgi:hypothetical protein